MIPSVGEPLAKTRFLKLRWITFFSQVTLDVTHHPGGYEQRALVPGTDVSRRAHFGDEADRSSVGGGLHGRWRPGMGFIG